MQKKAFAKFNALLDWQRTKESNPGTPNIKKKSNNVRSGIYEVEKRRKKMLVWLIAEKLGKTNFGKTNKKKNWAK